MKCCGTCGRLDDVVGYHGSARCGFIGELRRPGHGSRCRAYLERGRETVTLEGYAQRTGDDSFSAHLFNGGVPAPRFPDRLLARVVVIVALPGDPPTVEGFTE